MGPLFCTFLILLFSFGTYVLVLHAVLGLGLVSLVSVDFALRAVSFPLGLHPHALRAGFMASFIPFGSGKQIFLVFSLLYFSSEFANRFHSESLAAFPVFLSKRKMFTALLWGRLFWQKSGPKVCCYSPVVVAGFPSQPTSFIKLIFHHLLFSGLFYIPLEF